MKNQKTQQMQKIQEKATANNFWRNTLVIGIGLLIFLGLLLFLHIYRVINIPFLNNLPFVSSSNVLEYVPSDFDEIIYMDINQDFNDFIEKSGYDIVNQSEYIDMNQIDQMVMYTKLQQQEVINIMFVQSKPGFDPESMLRNSLLPSIGSIKTKDLGKGVYAYGDEESLKFLNNYDQQYMLKDSKYSEYIDDIQSQKYNLMRIIKPENATSQVNPMVDAFLHEMEYDAFLMFLSDDEIKGFMDIVFLPRPDRQVKLADGYDYKPKFNKYLDANTLMFAETGNLLDSLQMDKTEFKTQMKQLMKSYLLNFYPMIASSLQDQDYDNILSLLDGHIGIAMSKADNVMGIGAKVIFENADAYDTFQNFMPEIKNFVDRAGLSGNVQYIQEQDRFGINLQMPYLIGQIGGDVVLEKKGQNLVLSILNPQDTNQMDYDLSYNKNTVVSFYINLGLIIPMIKQYSASSPQVNTEYLDYFANKKLDGNVMVNPDKIKFNFNIK